MNTYNKNYKNCHRRHTSESAKAIFLFMVFAFITAYSFSQKTCSLHLKNPVVKSEAVQADRGIYQK
jgi:hypothetical protein